MSIEVWIPKATDWLNSNQHIPNHGHRNAIVQAWKTAGYVAARNGKLPALQQAHVWCYLVKNPGGGRWDPGNWYPTAKAILDGMVQAGLLPDDDHKHLTGPDMRHGGVSRDNPGLRIVIEADKEGEPSGKNPESKRELG